MDKPPEKLSITPPLPGVYLFKNAKEKILYVGKARSLRNRLRSYFHKSISGDLRKSALVDEATDFSFVVTQNEIEALALESNFIKQYRPKYNVILKDDKNYPYLKITVTQQWPGIEVVRRFDHGGDIYIGPYVSSRGMRETLDFIRKYFHVRTCKYKIENLKRPCVEYQIGHCGAPCVGLISGEDYMAAVNEVIDFLKGDNQTILANLTQSMTAHSDALRYEKAAIVRDKIAAIRETWETQKVIDPALADSDVIGYYGTGSEGMFNVFFIRNGVLAAVKDFHIKDLKGLSYKQLLYTFIEQFYNKDIIPPERIIVAQKPAQPGTLRAWLKKRKGSPVDIIIPPPGTPTDILTMANETAKRNLSLKRGSPDIAIMSELAQRLNLSAPPTDIGAFDVSTISGSESAGAFIRWRDGRFAKDSYRRLKIKTVTGVDDYSMMTEIFMRVAKNLGDEFPHLLVIDGGKGQLESALSALRQLNAEGLFVDNAIAIISIAKNPDRVFIPGALRGISLEDGSQSSLFLKRIRDEVHRFAITYHRKLREQRMKRSPLENIKGISKKRRLELLRHFDSIEAIRAAKPEEISSLKGFNAKLAAKILAELQIP
ncbi:excinuclease ABC subunit UvrC [Candidatus Magnetominusculus dajiuhuensis]|uniref:excinuclease ABC subunit UvrC n=1 Tax=Candidatus Magnetominusculus dajiuhuensis TaxID=3137712 RepID=UPI003B428823